MTPKKTSPLPLALMLALVATDAGAPAFAQPQRAPSVRDLNLTARRPRQPVDGAGVVVVSARGVEPGLYGGGTAFAALTTPASDGAGALPQIVNATTFFVAANGGRGRRDARLREYVAYQAPPGRYVFERYAWRTGTSTPGRQYCFGTIAFDLAAGDVLYIGDIVGAGGDDPVIDFDLPDATRALAALPGLQARIRPAQILENIQFECDWAEMARFQLTNGERARLVAGGALPAPPPEDPATARADPAAAPPPQPAPADTQPAPAEQTAPAPESPPAPAN